MLTAVTAPLRSLRRRVPGIEPYALGTAWLFIVFSVAHLAWVIGAKWSDPSGLTTLYETTVADGGIERTAHAWGLAYAGTGGLLLAAMQTIAVVTAAVITAVPAASGGRLRGVAHGVLIAWAALWMLDLAHLARLDLRPESFGQAAIASLFFTATLYRALPRGLRVGDEPPANAPEQLVIVASESIESEPADTEPTASRSRRLVRGALGRARSVARGSSHAVRRAGHRAAERVRSMARRTETRPLSSATGREQI